jgi:hypothetical protein
LNFASWNFKITDIDTEGIKYSSKYE